MKTAIRISIIIYSVLLAAMTLDLLIIPGFIPFENSISYGFIAVGIFCTIMLCSRIESLKFSPVILIAVFLVGGRTVAFSADFAFKMLTGKALYQLPFGSIGFFLFCILSPALLKQIRNRDREMKSSAFHPLALISLVVLSLPIIVHIIPAGFSVLSVYSVVFALTAAYAGGAAISFIKTNPGQRLIGYFLLSGILIDLLVYLNMLLDDFILPELNIMLLPFVLIVLTSSLHSLKVEDIDG